MNHKQRQIMRLTLPGSTSALRQLSGTLRTMLVCPRRRDPDRMQRDHSPGIRCWSDEMKSASLPNHHFNQLI